MSKVATKMITTYSDGTPVQENPYSERNAKLKVRAANTYKNIKKIEAVNDEGEVIDTIYVSSAAASEVAALGQLNEQLSAKSAEAEKAKAELEAMKAELEAAKEAAKSAEAEKAKAEAALKAKK
jgi:hypothetical protein